MLRALLILLLPVLAAAAPAPTRGTVQESATVISLLSANPDQLNTVYLCRGITTTNDNMGGIFYWAKGDVTATNASDCFAWGSGRLKKFNGLGSGYYVSVKDYGAKGDGISDDSSSIQAAINANPGKGIHFPSGTYLTSRTITNAATLIGESPRVAILTNSGNNGYMIKSASGTPFTEGIYFANLQFSGNGTANGIYMEDALRNRLQNVYVTNCVDGLNLVDAYITYVDGCRFDWCTGKAIRLNGGSGHMIKATTIEQCGQALTFDSGTGALFIDGCVIEGNYKGIVIPELEDLPVIAMTIQGTFFEVNPGGDVIFSSTNTTASVESLSLIGNIHAAANAGPLNFKLVSGLNAIGNQFRCPVTFEPTVSGLVLQGNTYVQGKTVNTESVVDMDDGGEVSIVDTFYRRDSLSLRGDTTFRRVDPNYALLPARSIAGYSTNGINEIGSTRINRTNDINRLVFEDNLGITFSLYQPPSTSDVLFSTTGAADGEVARFSISDQEFRVGNINGTNVSNKIGVSRKTRDSDVSSIVFEDNGIANMWISQGPGSSDLVFTPTGLLSGEVFRVDSGGIRSKGNTFLGAFTSMPNDTWLYGRNAADSANLILLGLDAYNQVRVSSAGVKTVIAGTADIYGDGSTLSLYPAATNNASLITWKDFVGGSARGSVGFAVNGTTNMTFNVNNGYADVQSGYGVRYYKDTNKVASIESTGALTTGGNTNQWIFKGVTVGATTNLTVNINGKDYTFQAW